MGAKFFKVDCTAKLDVSEVLEDSIITWGDNFTLSAKWDGPEAITRVDFSLNNTLKHRENRTPWHVNGDWIPVQLESGPKSASATFYAGNKRLGTVTRHFTIGLPISISRATPGVVSQTSFPVNKYGLITNGAGDHCRFWHTLQSWTTLPKASDFKKYTRPGSNVACITPNVNSKEIPTVEQAERYFKAVGQAVQEAGVTVAIEVINEPNLKKYSPASSDQYINNILAPAYEALNPLGIKVIGGAPSEDLTYLRGLKARGYLDLCDYAAFHPYQRTFQKHVDVSKAAKDIVGDKELMATEWNGHFDQGGMSLEEWSDCIPALFEAVSPYYKLIHYYRITVSGQFAGKAGLLDAGANYGTQFLNDFNLIPQN